VLRKNCPGSRSYSDKSVSFPAPDAHARPLSSLSYAYYVAAPPPPKRTRYEMYKGVDADYYGYRDDDDGTLAVVERLEEEQGMHRDGFQLLLTNHAAFAAKIEALKAWKTQQIQTLALELKSEAQAREK
jgi:hypothetical protein